jgi:hypothetical protein
MYTTDLQESSVLGHGRAVKSNTGFHLYSRGEVGTVQRRVYGITVLYRVEVLSFVAVVGRAVCFYV